MGCLWGGVGVSEMMVVWCSELVMGWGGVGWDGVVIEKGGRVLMVVEWCGGLRMRSVTPGDKKSGCRRAI